MSAKKRPTHPRQLAGLTRRTSPPAHEAGGEGTYGWLGEIPEKVRQRRAASGIAPASGAPSPSEPPDGMRPPSHPPDSAPRPRRPSATDFEPEPAPNMDAPFDWRATLKIKALSIDEIFDAELVLERAQPNGVDETPAAEEPDAPDEVDETPAAEDDDAIAAPAEGGHADDIVEAKKTPSDAKALLAAASADELSSSDFDIDIAGSIEEALDSSPPPRRVTPIRVSMPLFSAVHYDNAGVINVEDDDSADDPS